MQKKLLLISLLLFMGLCYCVPSIEVYADEKKPTNITTDKNGTVKIELSDPSNMKYKITITPNKGYAIDLVKLYYSNSENSYIRENQMSFENGSDNTKIWYYRSQKNYDRQEIEVTFRKISNEGTLILTAVNDEVSYGKDIQIKLQLKDAKGKDVKVTQKGELCLFAPLKKLYYSEFFSKETGNISDNNIINIDSTILNGTTDLVFSGYYEDTNTGFVTNISDVKIKISGVKTAIKLENSTQVEGHVSPLTATSTPHFDNISVTYKILKNNSYTWISEVPQWPGTYEVKAYISDMGIADAAEATATLTVKEDGLPDEYKAKSYISSNNQDHYVKATINNDTLSIEGACQDDNINGYTLFYGSNNRNIDLNGKKKSFLTTIDISSFTAGAYDIKLYEKHIKGNNISVPLDLMLIKDKDETYFLESQSLAINTNAIDKINKNNTNDKDMDLSDPKYAPIVTKAKEITESADSEYKKMQLIYTWIAENIYYNYDQFLYHKNITEQDALSVYNSKIAVCAGYSNLFHVMLKSVGINDIIITAYARIDGDYRFGIDKNDGHAWNMVYSSEMKRWILIDVTWGSRNTYSNQQKAYKGSNMLWFDCSLQALSKSHLYNLTEVTTKEPVFNDPYTIKVGETLSLFDFNEIDCFEIRMGLSPSNILRTTENNEVQAISAGICDVSIDITTKTGKEFKKYYTITVIDPNFKNGLTDVDNIKIDENNTDVLNEEKIMKTYSFRTNNDVGAYVFHYNNLSKNNVAYGRVIDSNGIQLDSYTCKSNYTIDFPLNLDKNTIYYVEIFTDEVTESGDLNYQFTIDSQKKNKDKLYKGKTRTKFNVGETAKLTDVFSIDNYKIKSINWKSYDEDVATVSSDGVVKGIHSGISAVECIIKCENGSKITILFDIYVN